MRFLLISCVCCLFMACRSYPEKQNFTEATSQEQTIENPYFSDPSKDYVYKASIDVYGNNFGGLLIVKKMGEATYRIAFTTEMGNKLFDFSLENEALKVNYCMDALNRKLLLNVLEKDFTTLISQNLNVKHAYINAESRIFESELYDKKHFYFLSSQLDKIVRVTNGKEKVVFEFNNVVDNMARQIAITHNNIDLNIHLKTIY